MNVSVIKNQALPMLGKRCSTWVITVLTSVCSISAMAAEMHLTAEFKPDPTNPAANVFINTTPVSGYCHNYPSQCAPGISSFVTPITTSWVPIAAGAPDLLQSAMMRVTNEEKVVTVYGPGGVSETVSFKITHLGGRYRTAPSAFDITGASGLAAHKNLWKGSSWVNPPTGCGYSGQGSFVGDWYSFYWVNTTGGICGKIASFDIPQFRIHVFELGYSMTTPNPLGMRNGTYTGEVTYSVGPGADIDFGNVSIASDDQLTFKFTLEVDYVFGMQFPANASRLTLNPQGGWNQWLQSGRVPNKLTAHQDFTLWTSLPFTMVLDCPYTVGDKCAIANSSGDMVAVDTLVTLPRSLTVSGSPVNRLPLSTSHETTATPSTLVDNARATLHFEVPQSGVEQMTRSAGSRYSGNVTFIIDMQIDTP